MGSVARNAERLKCQQSGFREQYRESSLPLRRLTERTRSNTKTGPLSYGVTLNNSPNGAYTIPGGFQTKTVSFTVVQ